MVDVQSERQSGREFRRETTRIERKKRRDRKRSSVFMEECDRVQCKGAGMALSHQIGW